MEKISAWIFTICSATILVTVVGFFIKDEKLFKGIKMILSLYIILTALSFPLGAKTISNSLEVPQYKAVEPVNTDALLRAQVAGELEKELNSALDEKMIKAQCTQVTLAKEINMVSSVSISAQNAESGANAKAALQEILEKDVVININIGSE